MDQICSITDHDDMDIGEIGKRKAAILAVIPDNDTSLSYLVGMLYTQIIQELYYQADHVYRGRLPGLPRVGFRSCGIPCASGQKKTDCQTLGNYTKVLFHCL